MSTKAPNARFFIALLLTLCSSLAANLYAADRKTITWSTQFGPVLQRSEVKLGGHTLSLQTRQDVTSSADPDWDGSIFVVSGIADVVDGAGPMRGCGTRTHKGGDQSHVCYQGTLKLIGDTRSSEGTVQLLGGTGKFANLKGSGRFTSTGKTVTVTAEVEY